MRKRTTAGEEQQQGGERREMDGNLCEGERVIDRIRATTGRERG